LQRRIFSVIIFSIAAVCLFAVQALATPIMPKKGVATLSAATYLGDKGIEMEGSYGFNNDVAFGIEGIFNTDHKSAFGLNIRYKLTQDAVLKGTVMNIDSDGYIGGGIELSRNISGPVLAYGSIEGYSGNESFFRYNVGVGYRFKPGVVLRAGYAGTSLDGLPDGNILLGISF